jgi:hypothetical protein
MAEFGISVMQKGRLARLIEEAYLQDAILDGPRLLLFIMESHRGIRSHLQHFWQQGIILPLAGMNTVNRQMMHKLRPVLAIKSYLEGEELDLIRKKMAISTSRWQKLWNDFKELGRQDFKEEQTDQPPEVIAAWKELWQAPQAHPFRESYRKRKNHRFLLPAAAHKTWLFSSRSRTIYRRPA